MLVPGGLYDYNDSSCSSVRDYATSGATRWKNAVTVRPDNRPVIAVILNSGDQTVISCNDAECATATTTAIAPAMGYFVYSQAVALRSDGRPLGLFLQMPGRSNSMIA